MSGIAAITEREIELISRFVELLTEEQDALKRGDAAALPRIATAKAPLVEQLNAFENERRMALGIDGEQKTRQAMDAWLATHPAEQTAAADWARLLELAQEAKQLHELNASLVSMHLQQTAEALAILTRKAEQNTLYGSNGQTAPISGSRIVDSA